MISWTSLIHAGDNPVGLDYPRCDYRAISYYSELDFILFMLKLWIIESRLVWLLRTMEFFFATMSREFLRNISEESLTMWIFWTCSTRLVAHYIFNVSMIICTFFMLTKYYLPCIWVGWIPNSLWSDDWFDHYTCWRERSLKVFIVYVSNLLNFSLTPPSDVYSTCVLHFLN